MSWVRNLRLLPGDFVVAGVVILLSGVLAVPFLSNGTETVYAEIYQDEVLVRRILLVDGIQETVMIDGKVTNTIQVEGKTVRFSASSCPDQVCVHTGTLTRAGQTAVCLPNRVIVRLSGGETEVDAVAGGAVR